MIQLNEYIVNKQIIEELQCLKDTEQINEGRVTRAIKKFWKWLVGDKDKKSNFNKYYVNGDNVENGKITGSLKSTHKGYSLYDIDVDKLDELLNTNRNIDKYKVKDTSSSDIKYICKCLALVNDNDKLVALLTYTTKLDKFEAFQKMDNSSQFLLVLGLEYDTNIIADTDSGLRDLFIVACEKNKKSVIIITNNCYLDKNNKVRKLFNEFDFEEKGKSVNKYGYIELDDLKL